MARDDGTVLTLGLVGVVAVAGAVMARRRTGSRASDMRRPVLSDFKRGRVSVPLYEHIAFEDPRASEAFVRWFGNSTVKDDTGRPVVVYHGTTSGGFTQFDLSRMGPQHPGFYFTNDLRTASTFVRGKMTGILMDPALGCVREGAYRLYLKIERPFVHDAKGREWTDLVVPEFPQAHSTYEVAHAAKAAGYDGAVFRNIRDTDLATEKLAPADVYVVFDPRNIKSATANVGTFDPNDPRISYNRSPR